MLLELWAYVLKTLIVYVFRIVGQGGVKNTFFGKFKVVMFQKLPYGIKTLLEIWARSVRCKDPCKIVEVLEML